MTPLIDYTPYRLNTEADLKPYYSQTFSAKAGALTFWQYAERLYRKITMMVPGEILSVDDLVDEDNRDVFIKMLCAFMLSGIAQGYYFNATYTEFRRMPALIQQSNENILKKKQYDI